MIYKNRYNKAAVDINVTLFRLSMDGLWKIQFESDFSRYDTLSRIIPHYGLRANIIFDDWIPFSPGNEDLTAKIHSIAFEKYNKPLNVVFNQDLANYLETLGYKPDEWDQRFKDDYPLEHQYFASQEPTELDGEVALGDLPAYIQSIVLHDLSKIYFMPMEIDFEYEFNNHLKSEILYEPEDMRDFYLTAYEYLDNLDFMRKPKDLVHDYYLYEEVAREMFEKADWNGDGEITLIWIPPFMLKEPEGQKKFRAVETYVWHVKQKSDGTSYLLSPFEIFN